MEKCDKPSATKALIAESLKAMAKEIANNATSVQLNTSLECRYSGVNGHLSTQHVIVLSVPATFSDKVCIMYQSQGILF